MRISTQKCKEIKLIHLKRLIHMAFLEGASRKDTLIHLWSSGKVLKADTYSSSLLNYHLLSVLLRRVSRHKPVFVP